MEALAFRRTWELVSVPTDVVIVGCHFVFTLNYHPDRSVDKYKAILVVKGILKHRASTILRRSRQLPG